MSGLNGVGECGNGKLRHRFTSSDVIALLNNTHQYFLPSPQTWNPIFCVYFSHSQYNSPYFSNIVCSFLTDGRGTLNDGVLVNRRGDCTCCALGGLGTWTSASGRSMVVSRTHSFPQHRMNRHLLFCIWWMILTAHTVKLANRPPITIAISRDAICIRT